MNTEKIKIPGAILIFSCHRHLNTRLKEPEFGLKKKEYNGWKVYYILGNPNQNTEYIMNGNLITIKCEDSYIHLLKKVILAIKIILGIYDVQEGILRCGDDLIFNENKLLKFLNKNDKDDYIGNIVINEQEKHITKQIDYFMPLYFNSHREDLLNPLNGLNMPIEKLLSMNERPSVSYAIGVVVYLSVNSCNKLIYSMNSINWDIFKYYDKFGYPYIIEDVGVGFILNLYKIKPTSCELYSCESHGINDVNDILAYHTNKYK